MKDFSFNIFFRFSLVILYSNRRNIKSNKKVLNQVQSTNKHWNLIEKSHRIPKIKRMDFFLNRNWKGKPKSIVIAWNGHAIGCAKELHHNHTVESDRCINSAINTNEHDDIAKWGQWSCHNHNSRSWQSYDTNWNEYRSIAAGDIREFCLFFSCRTQNDRTKNVSYFISQKKYILQTTAEGVSIIDVAPIEQSDSTDETPINVSTILPTNSSTSSPNSSNSQQITAQVAFVQTPDTDEDTKPHFITVNGKRKLTKKIQISMSTLARSSDLNWCATCVRIACTSIMIFYLRFFCIKRGLSSLEIISRNNCYLVSVKSNENLSISFSDYSRTARPLRSSHSPHSNDGKSSTRNEWMQ